VKSIKSEFSNGLFTQTLDMVKFHLADTYEPKAQSNAHHPDEGGGGEDLAATPTYGPGNLPISPGNSITVDDTTIPIEETRSTTMIAGTPVGDVLTRNQMAAIEVALSMGNTYPPDILTKYKNQKASQQGPQ
jgi:hypothetical protein